jgi:hypothetical protein
LTFIAQGYLVFFERLPLSWGAVSTLTPGPQFVWMRRDGVPLLVALPSEIADVRTLEQLGLITPVQHYSQVMPSQDAVMLVRWLLEDALV